jgi:hypothetical protein
MKRFTFSLVLCCATALLGCDNKLANSLVGKWKSDTSKSLQSMRSIKEIPEETRAYFEKDFFGRLTIEYKDKTYSAILEGEENIKPDEFPYRIVEETPEYYIVENELLGTKFNKKLFKDRSCYYELTSEYNFREYFCRVTD